MPRHFSAIASFSGIVCLALASMAEDAVRITWRPEVMAAWRTAQDSKRPLLVFVSMESCGFCKKMERDTLLDRQVAEHVERSFIAAKIDGTKDAALARRLGVKVYPTTVIISPENKVLDAISGYVGAEQLRSRLAACDIERVADTKKVGSGAQ